MQLASRALAASAAALSAPRAAKCAVPAPVAVSASRSKAVAPTRRSQGPGRQVSVKVAAPESPASSGEVIVNFDNTTDSGYTVISVQANNKPGLLTSITALFRDLGVDVGKAVVEGDEDRINDKFYVRSLSGGKLSEDKAADCVKALDVLLRSKPTGTEATRPKFENTAATGGTGKARLYTLMDTYMKNDVLSIQEDIVNHVEYTLARSRVNFDNFEAYQATSFSLRDRLIERWNDTQTWFKEKDPKRVYYLSMEFLMGRSLLNTLYNLDIKESYQEALAELGYDLETLADLERDAALGNGGLGRLAACFLDSMATLNLPAWGYGIRYQYGMFRQTIQNGFQHEQPDYWLTFGNPWEIERLIVSYPIKFYGHVSVVNEDGRQLFRWNAGETVTAVAYDNPIPGFGTRNCINLRLWAAKPSKEFDLEAFNTGDYVAAILSKQRAETLSSVLYPDDRTYEGKELRLKQQYFFVSASLQDVMARFKVKHGDNWKLFPDKACFQLNDTHPTIAVAELMRLLVDVEGLDWEAAWSITTKCVNYTNHTVMPEALEKWPVKVLAKMLPRHMEIIEIINAGWTKFLEDKYSSLASAEREALLERMSIIQENPWVKDEMQVNMAYLAVVSSSVVNGVAAIHSEIVKQDIFNDFYKLFPEKFQNKTNGVTPRRWLAFCNPALSALITKTLGSDNWITDTYELSKLKPYAEDKAFQEQWRAVKLENKKKLAAYIKETFGDDVPLNALFDIQIKRIHEYKRQLMNVLSIIQRYKELKAMTPEERKKVVPRVCMFGGKAASAYDMAKRIIHLAVKVGEKINKDPDTKDLLRCYFLPDYNVSLAEVIIPASELSQHISTAGTEASGTSNMKFQMNGCLIIGTMDGANIEIAEESGKENMFVFGVDADDVPRLRKERKNLKTDKRFDAIMSDIEGGMFGDKEYFKPLVDSISNMKVGNDWFLVANDFASYLDAQKEVDECYKDPTEWTRRSILYTAGSGKFSSDRTIVEYAKDIWHVQPARPPSSN